MAETANKIRPFPLYRRGNFVLFIVGKPELERMSEVCTGMAVFGTTESKCDNNSKKFIG